MCRFQTLLLVILLYYINIIAFILLSFQTAGGPFWTEVLCSSASDRLHVPSNANSKPRFVTLDHRSPFRDFVVCSLFIQDWFHNILYFDSFIMLQCVFPKSFPHVEKGWDLLASTAVLKHRAPPKNIKNNMTFFYKHIPTSLSVCGYIDCWQSHWRCKRSYERSLPKNCNSASLASKQSNGLWHHS